MTSDPREPPPAASGSGAKRLGRADWIEAAMRVMADSSVEQVRVEKLAVDLKASKGSFYWHFKDRHALLDAVLEAWQERSTLAVQERLIRDEPDPSRRIARLMELPFHSGAAARAADLELAIMGWARRSEAARAAVGRVDAVRTDYLVAQFQSLGMDRDEAEWRAHQAYALLRYVAQRTDLPLASRQAMVARLHARLTQESVAGR
ncbi:TetR/AcrR family transcriptional regulator [Novosphingobium pokkalii]|uniref:TetR/AcrR family transcriptional regulator n=1 Tax=Novosphingobium pokkalii TaxID=1770194 RepID=A0ABV7VAD4_9SPHN|nr:TetR/AcrR family transcriptional regulator [Novosphingobium pokkalii]GHD03331.1 TetR family transcriptional regulator [Novosphingobium pokkalii]